MAQTIISLLFKYEAKIFACVISKDVQKPKNFNHEDYLRKDHVCLMERFADFLKERHEDGLMIMDQCEKIAIKSLSGNYLIIFCVHLQEKRRPVGLFRNLSLSNRILII